MTTNFTDKKMRRPNGGNYYEPLPSNGSHGDKFIKSKNDDLTVQDNVNTLKSLSIDIGAEVNHQNRLLRDMDYDLESTGEYLNNTLGQVTRLGENDGGYYLLYLLLFIFAVFLILYIFFETKTNVFYM